jgi:LPXTG-motif cell wall-anchored protein
MMSRSHVKWMFHHSLTTIGVAVVCGLLIGPASAQLTEHKTVVTFSAPIEVPGSTPQVLPAGSYTFKVVDSKVNRNIVQVSDMDEKHVYTTILAIPTHRDEESSKTVMTFEERPAGTPQALRAWFYPNEKEGQEFVYSRAKAVELAKASNSPVPFTESSSVETVSAATSQSVASPQNTPSASIQTMLPTGQTASVAPYTQQALAAPPAPIQAQTRQETSATTPAPPASSPASLPRTGSNLPFLGLIGCLSLIAGISLRKWRLH